eukprot:gene2972-3425_t
MGSSGDYAVVGLLSAASLLSFVGSVSIIVAAVINKKLRGYTHILIINQAAADMLLSSISIPLRTLRLAVKGEIFDSKIISSRAYCKQTTFMSIFLFGASVLSLFLLTLDRFLGIRFPIQYKYKCKKRYVWWSIVISWLLAFVIGFCPLLFTQLQSKLNLHSSDTACVYGTVITLGYMIFVNISTLYLPLLTMVLMYLLIIQKVHKSWRVFTKRGSKHDRKMRRASVVDPNLFRKKEIKLARGIFCILFTHIICLTPIAVIDWMYTFSGIKSPVVLIKICLVLTYANAVADPIIYAAFSQEYKRAFWRLLTCKSGGQRNQYVNTTTASHANTSNPTAVATICAKEAPKKTIRSNTSIVLAKVDIIDKRVSDTINDNTLQVSDPRNSSSQISNTGHDNYALQVCDCDIIIESPAQVLRNKSISGTLQVPGTNVDNGQALDNANFDTAF